MIKKNKDTPPKKEKPIKEKKTSKNKSSSKIENELSDLAKSLNIRVSSPYGYYPEDVDPIISQLQKDVSSLTKENKKLADENNELKSLNSSLKSELTHLKMQMTMMEIPDLSAEEEFSMLGRIDSITGNYDSQSVPELKQMNQPLPTSKLRLKSKS